jgi:NADPH-dependent curcumin reductase CurA
MTTNRQWLLKERPTAMVGPEHFELVESSQPTADLGAGEVLLKTVCLGFDPAMRGWLIDEPSYLPPVAIGEVMRSSSVSEVIASENPEFAVGSLVQGMTGWQEYAVGSAGDLIPPRALPEGVPADMALSVFGTTTFTAYFGLLDICDPQPGETVLVSGAAGATGSMVAQIAKLKGCRVIGIAGGTEKCAWLQDSCGADEVIDYKNEDVAARLAELCPLGINVFFDNVGGDILQAGIEQMADFGRISLCGGISGYNDEAPSAGPDNLMILVQRRVKMQGFIVIDYMDRFDAAAQEIAEWVMAGKLAWRVDMQQGFENIPHTLQRLFTGENQGKQLLSLA